MPEPLRLLADDDRAECNSLKAAPEKGKLPGAFELSKQTLRWRVEEINRWVTAGMPDLKTWEAMAAK